MHALVKENFLCKSSVDKNKIQTVSSYDKELRKKGNHSYDSNRIIQLTQADEKMGCYVQH